jgi:hypothetical protein
LSGEHADSLSRSAEALAFSSCSRTPYAVRVATAVESEAPPPNCFT